ncbi:MAG: ABC transporter substrate-binding protein [Oligoflexia bacterium]|nr:ABC transporter substrate-binding protein [Oligoflexia bacterium]
MRCNYAFTILLGVLILSCVLNVGFAQEKVKVGFVDQVGMKAFEDGKKGFMEGLKEKGFESKIEVVYHNLNNNMDLVKDTIDKLKKENVKVIVTQGTKVTLEFLKVVKDIPIVYTSVTYPQQIDEIGKNLKFGDNYSGATIYTPQLPLIKLALKIKPDIKTIGIVVNSDEVNSKRDAGDLEKAAKELKLKSIISEYPGNNKDNNLLQKSVVAAFNKLIDSKVDAIMFPKDTLQVKFSNEIKSVVIPKKILTLATDASFAEKGVAVMAFTATCQKAGQNAGVIVTEILSGKKPKDIPPMYLDSFDIYLNTKTAKEMNISLPVDMIRMASTIIKE